MLATSPRPPCRNLRPWEDSFSILPDHSSVYGLIVLATVGSYDQNGATFASVLHGA